MNMVFKPEQPLHEREVHWLLLSALWVRPAWASGAFFKIENKAQENNWEHSLPSISLLVFWCLFKKCIAIAHRDSVDVQSWIKIYTPETINLLKQAWLRQTNCSSKSSLMSADASTDNTTAVRSVSYSNQELGTCKEQKISTYVLKGRTRENRNYILHPGEGRRQKETERLQVHKRSKGKEGTHWSKRGQRRGWEQ